IMLGAGVYVLVEAFNRLGADSTVASGPMLLGGALGLLVNVVSLVLLRRGSTERLAGRGAYLAVPARARGSAAAVGAAGGGRLASVGPRGGRGDRGVRGGACGDARSAGLRRARAARAGRGRPRRGGGRTGLDPWGPGRARPAPVDPHVRHGRRDRSSGDRRR